eukprot:scpid75084/ scgid8145/ 
MDGAQFSALRTAEGRQLLSCLNFGFSSTRNSVRLSAFIMRRLLCIALVCMAVLQLTNSMPMGHNEPASAGVGGKHNEDSVGITSGRHARSMYDDESDANSDDDGVSDDALDEANGILDGLLAQNHNIDGSSSEMFASSQEDSESDSAAAYSDADASDMESDENDLSMFRESDFNADSLDEAEGSEAQLSLSNEADEDANSWQGMREEAASEEDSVFDSKAADFNSDSTSSEMSNSRDDDSDLATLRDMDDAENDFVSSSSDAIDEADSLQSNRANDEALGFQATDDDAENSQMDEDDALTARYKAQLEKMSRSDDTELDADSWGNTVEADSDALTDDNTAENSYNSDSVSENDDDDDAQLQYDEDDAAIDTRVDDSDMLDSFEAESDNADALDATQYSAAAVDDSSWLDDMAQTASSSSNEADESYDDTLSSSYAENDASSDAVLAENSDAVSDSLAASDDLEFNQEMTSSDDITDSEQQQEQWDDDSDYHHTGNGPDDVDADGQSLWERVAAGETPNSDQVTSDEQSSSSSSS